VKDRYNFDKVIDRRGTNAVKVDALGPRYGDAGLIPLWVADMDFESCPAITEALKRRLEHPVFGYSEEPPGYRPAIAGWLRRRQGLEIRPEWLSFIPGVVTGIGLAVNVFTERGDKVIIQPPVYHPFRLVPQANGREVVYNPLILNDEGRYRMDLDQLESVIDERCKLLILCNPHNPGGTIWSRQELIRLAEICAARGILVVSDEIHADLPLFGQRHIPFASVSETAAQNSITFGAPSKTFNIAGLVSSYAVVPSDSIRRRFFSWLEANGLNHVPLIAATATEAAFTAGDSWLDALIGYLEGNVSLTTDYLAREIPRIRPMRPDASFLVWLDCRGLGLDHRGLVDLFVKKAGLALNDGTMFGPGGEGFMRLNIGTPRSVVQQALEQLKENV
jgi:cystathionine beta-lyase